MTLKGKSVTLKGEILHGAAGAPVGAAGLWHCENLFLASDDDFIKHNCEVAGTGRVAEFYSKGIYFRHTQGTFPQETKLLLTHGFPFINMAFCVSGSRYYQPATSVKPIAQLKQHQHNLFFFPKQRLQLTWPTDEQAEFFDIYMSTESFFRYLPPSHPLAISFRGNMAQNSTAQLSSISLPLTPRIISLLYEILNCQFSGHCKCLFAEAKVVELLALQLDQQGHLPAASGHEGLKNEDVEKMQQARELLLVNLEAHLSLKDLAHQVGTNEYNLKKHFKEVFGTTVYGYLHQHKMEQARELLLQGDTRIAEVAHRMGYKHGTHFTSAFKKHYGFSPNKLKVG